MQFHMFPPELLHVVAYGGWLVPHDVLNLACASEALMEKLVGDEYGKDWLRALSGLKKCVENDCTRAVRFALQTEDPSVDDNWPIRHAAEYGQTKTVQVLLADPRVDPSAQANYAIRWASVYGQTETVQVLLADPRVDPSEQRECAILT